MNPPLTALLELEMFHRVRDVNFRPVDARLRQGAIEQPACGADKLLACEIFLVTGLLANHNDACCRSPFTSHRLRRISIQVAPLARLHRVAKLAQCRALWNKRLRTWRFGCRIHVDHLASTSKLGKSDPAGLWTDLPPVQQQASVLAYIDIFRISGLVCLGAILFLFFVKKTKPGQALGH
ncbi:MAG TPA: hypothetical protein VMJ75_11590 [Candidatus Acidoferrales bacterium]|nr:hypothetical protein [Candidatus Acidoferrales bacterium]